MQIKGIREGLLVSLGEGNWGDLQAELFQQVEERENFFQGAKLALDVGPLGLNVRELSTLRDRLSEKGISLWAVVSSSGKTEQTAQNLGLATRLSAPRPERTVKTLEQNLTGESAMFVQRTLRSGVKVTFAGHIVVVGDVNPGAEIIAGGCVVVWGKLRGVVHAGAQGDEQAVVCALDLSPTQLRIAEQIATAPTRKSKAQPEMARIQDGQVVAETWTPSERNR